MKKPSDHIFRLIHSMTPAEKRYFKRHFASNQSVLTQLFDFINKMKSYDEEILKKHFSHGVAKNLKVYKVQLYELLINSLQAFNSNKNIKTKIRRGLEEVDILLDKQLYDLAGDRLKKLKALCLKYEEYTYLVELAYKMFFVHHLNVDQIGISEHPVFQEVEQYLKKMEQHNRLSFLGHQLVDERRRADLGMETKAEDYYKQLLEHPNIKGELSSDLPFHTQLTRNTILSFIHTYLGNENLHAQSREDNVRLFDQAPHFKKTMAFRYIGVLRNYLNYCSAKRKYSEIPFILEKAETYAQENPNMAMHLIHFYYAELQMHFYQGNYKQLHQNIEPKILRHLKQYKIEYKRVAILNYFYLLISHLINEDYQEVEQYLKVIKTANTKLSEPFSIYIILLEMIYIFETEDDERLEKLLKKKKKELLQGDVFCEAMYKLFDQFYKEPFNKKVLFDSLESEKYTYEESAIWKIFKFHQLDEWINAYKNRRSFSEWMFSKLDTIKKAEH